ncbi:organic cation transporter protein [Anabrus simplex]|uniref:organic cation transporter protein n=1 Tax=Anabrus simplex TaxID=316456 RepID=UPI0035A36452
MAPGVGEDVVQGAMGDFGRWQLWICLSISVLKLPVAWHQLGIVFLAPPTTFWCADSNSSSSAMACDKPCNAGWVFDRTVFEETIITQWELVCSRAQLANVAQTVFMLGVLLGNVLFGIAADRIGRKTPLVASVVLQLFAGIGVALVPWFPGFLVLRFLLALATGGTMITSFVICMEILGGRWRLIVSTLYHIPFSLGHTTLAGIAYYARDWHNFQLALTLPSILLLSYWWLIPESPRWLLAVGRYEEATAVLEKAMKKNKIEGVDINQVVQSYVKEKGAEPERTGNMLDLFRTPNMRVKTLCIYYNWMVCGLCFFGLAQYIGHVGGDIFINVAVSGVIEIPGALLCIYWMDRFGRRPTLLSGQLLAAAACLLLIAVPSDLTWPTVTLAAVGILGMSTSFPTIYLFSGELFPTVVRNVGVGSSSMCARVGSMVAPFVTSLAMFGYFLPPLVFGGIPLIGALLCLLLPETNGFPLPDSLQDGEEFGKKKTKTTRATNISENGEANKAYVDDSTL